MIRRIPGVVAALALQVVAVVLAHELVFLARYGSRYNEALIHGGHGETWSAAVTTSVAVAVGLLAIGVLQLARLGLLVRRREAGRTPPAGPLEPRPLLRAWLRIAPRMALLSVVLLTIQENLERAAIGQAMPGFGLLLSPEYAGGLWIAIAVALAVGLLAALFDWRRRSLLARLRTARAGQPRGIDVDVLRPGILVLPPLDSLIGRRSALRAPPLMVAA